MLQLFTYEFVNFNNKELIWGDVVDGFQWVDKEGENIILRSVQMDVKNHISHLYIYHFLKTSDEFKLIRKLTDYVKKCDVNIFSSHNIESIELTDINKDTIGEISFSYTNDCSCIEDSLAISTKLMLITKGEKYAVRGLIDPKKKQPFIEYKVGASLKKNDLYRRFLIKKWKRISSEEKTIYN